MSLKATMEEMKKIRKLKKKARSAYIAYRSSGDGLSCGGNLAAYINKDVYKYAKEFNDILDELAKIDPDTPKDRLPLGSN